jgi:hypothetical protein
MPAVLPSLFLPLKKNKFKVFTVSAPNPTPKTTISVLKPQLCVFICLLWQLN